MYSRVYVEITNICNMACSFCHGHSRQAKRMSVSEVSCVLDCLRGLTGHVYFHLMGEPLTHPKLPRFVAMARERGLKPMITTNGSLLRERGSELIASAPHKVNVSLHSFEGDSAEDHLRYLSEVAEFAKRAADAGIIVILRLWNRGHDGGKNDSTLEFFRKNIDGEWGPDNRGIKIRRCLYMEWGDRFAWPDMGADDSDCAVACHGLRDHFGILADGTVVPCCLDSDGVISLGNVFREDLREILASDRAAAIKLGFERRSATEPLCRRCGYARR